MKAFYLFIFSVAITGFYKSASSHKQGYLPAVHRKRFLFQTVPFCFGPCNLPCAAGYQKSHMGCYKCACAGSSAYLLSSNLSSNQFLPSNFSVNAGHVGHFLTNPCDPSIRHCPLKCVKGYQHGVSGCELCECVEIPLTVTTVLPLTALAKATRPTGAHSPIVSTVPIYTSTGHSTSVSRPTTSSSSLGYFDPCIPTQIVCELDCNNDYILGPERCQYCLCADKIPSHLRHTTTKVPVIPPGLGRSNSSLSNSSKVVSKPTAEACVMAKVICNEKCPGGFISKPDDCLFCSCLIPDPEPSDEIVRVSLRKPCLYKSRSCKTKCKKGYVKGPRDCQFCSCLK